MTARFVQIHFLSSYPGTLLNRDDVGFAKRLTFGGAVRTRVSSQCLKRHWRTFDGKHALGELGLPDTVRSRSTFQRFIVEPLIAEGVGQELAAAAATAVRDFVLGGNQEKADAKAKKGQEAVVVEVTTGQVTVLGRPEIDYLKELSRKLAEAAGSAAKVKDAQKAVLDNETKKNLKALSQASGLGAALFGRMVTSDALARGDAAIHVAHALTVHAAELETDYFSAVDDLRSDDGELGSGHIGNTELTSGLYYGYVVVDVPLLVSNLTGCAQKDWQAADRSVAGRVVEHLLHIIATVSPGAKLGSTAPYARALAMLVEVGDEQPRTLANAFLSPVPTSKDVLKGAYGQLSGHVKEMDRAYGNSNARQCLALHAGAGLAEGLGAQAADNMGALAGWVAARVQAGA